MTGIKHDKSQTFGKASISHAIQFSQLDSFPQDTATAQLVGQASTVTSSAQRDSTAVSANTLATAPMACATTSQAYAPAILVGKETTVPCLVTIVTTATTASRNASARMRRHAIQSMAPVLVWQGGWVCIANAPVIEGCMAPGVLSSARVLAMSATLGTAAARRWINARKGSGVKVANIAVCVITKQPATRLMGNASARRASEDISVKSVRRGLYRREG